MSRINRILIFDKDGWRKEISVEKDIVYIGSDPRSDIHLSSTRGGGVAPTHAQVIASPLGGNPKMINLAPEPIFVGPETSSPLETLNVIDLTDGVSCRVGEFSLTFSLTSTFSALSSQPSDHIGLSISLPRTRLDPNKTIEGYIGISNQGELNNVQVSLDLKGLPSICYDIEPCPIMFAHSEKEVLLRIYHRGSLPLAGEHNITIHATAEKAYPGEEAVIVRALQVQPFFRHRLTVADPAQSSQKAKTTVATPQPNSEPASSTPPSATSITQIPLEPALKDPIQPSTSDSPPIPSEPAFQVQVIPESQPSWGVPEPTPVVAAQVLKMKAEAPAPETATEPENSPLPQSARADWWTEKDDSDSNPT